MANTQKVKSRFQQKIGTTQEWEQADAKGFIPLKGEIIVYQDYWVDEITYEDMPYPPRFKIGDGKHRLRAIAFTDADLIDQIEDLNTKTSSFNTIGEDGIEFVDNTHTTKIYGSGIILTDQEETNKFTSIENTFIDTPRVNTESLQIYQQDASSRNDLLIIKDNQQRLPLTITTAGTINGNINTTTVGPNSRSFAFSKHKASDIYKTTPIDEDNKKTIIEKWEREREQYRHPPEGTSASDAQLFSIAFGSNTFIEGQNTLADNCGHAEGSRTRATGSRAHSEGTDTDALGNNSHAEGQDSQAIGWASHAEGYGTIAGRGSNSGDSDGAHSEGAYTKALATASHAEGSQTEARAAASHTEGAGTIATREYQHVQGRYNYLDANGDAGNFVHIVGWGTSSARKNIHTLDSSGNAIFAGDVTSSKTSLNTLATNLNTVNNKIDTKAAEVTKQIAIKYGNVQTGNESGVLGLGATASARYGAAIGWKCRVVNAAHGFAIGAGAKATTSGQVALGQANNPDKEYEGRKAIFMVGNGSPADTAEGASARSNAFAVTANGTGYLNDKKILVEGDVYTKVQVDNKLTGDLNTTSLSTQTLTLGNTTFTEEQLIKILNFINSIEIGGNA